MVLCLTNIVLQVSSSLWCLPCMLVVVNKDDEAAIQPLFQTVGNIVEGAGICLESYLRAILRVAAKGRAVTQAGATDMGTCDPIISDMEPVDNMSLVWVAEAGRNC